jgi:hypothetical protein
MSHTQSSCLVIMKWNIKQVLLESIAPQFLVMAVRYECLLKSLIDTCVYIISIASFSFSRLSPFDVSAHFLADFVDRDIGTFPFVL